jgi:glycine/D-amino acid oxidase-like deaminating enzyme
MDIKTDELSNSYDYLIVGQGIAGTILAYTFLKNNKKILVIGDESLKSASEVAAGLYNPVTGKRLAKTWQADEIFPFLEDFYREMEHHLDEKFLYPCSVYRPYDNLSEQNDWIARTAKPEFKKFICNASPDILPDDLIRHPLGGIETFQAGWLDTNKMVQVCRVFFKNQKIYLNQKFDYQDIKITPDDIIWKEKHFKKVIFCEGIYGKDNPFFNFLPFFHVKGEILTLHINNANLSCVVNQGVYIFQTDKDTFKAGATYDWDAGDWQPTESGKQELTEKLDKLLTKEYKITEHLAGVRPVTQDRLPFVGLHPEFKPLAIFNGLGTKGISLAPWLAQKFTNFLDNKEVLPKEVQTERFYSLYFRQH